MKAILYDLDGVLVDACEWHYLSLNAALQEVSGFSIELEEHLSDFNGLPTKKKLDKLISQGRVKSDDYDIIWKLKQDKTIEIIKQNAKIDLVKQELHKYIKELGLKNGCVTNSIQETAALMLSCTGQLEYLDLLVTNEMVRKNKPNSECYVRAMVTLGVLPSETIIVEDSPVGLAAAEATGAWIWQVENAEQVTLANFKEKWSM